MHPTEKSVIPQLYPAFYQLRIKRKRKALFIVQRWRIGLARPKAQLSCFNKLWLKNQFDPFQASYFHYLQTHHHPGPCFRTCRTTYQKGFFCLNFWFWPVYHFHCYSLERLIFHTYMEKKLNQRLKDKWWYLLSTVIIIIRYTLWKLLLMMTAKK